MVNKIKTLTLLGSVASVLLFAIILSPNDKNILGVQDHNESKMGSVLSGLEDKFEAIKDQNRTFELTNNHFKNGSVVIDDNYVIYTDTEGNTVKESIATSDTTFLLSEDVSFNPNKFSESLPPSRSGYVNREQYEFYDPAAFGIGFFAALVVQAENVIIDLNGFTLEQSREHALQQRFYSNIELADQPFIPEQGPADFGSEIDSANGVAVINGTLGRSSHHGIHAQTPRDVLIKDLTIKDYEVAGISLHGAENVAIVDTDIEGNSREVEVIGLYSALRFIQPYIATLPDDYSMQVNGQRIGKYEVASKLASINDKVVSSRDWKNSIPDLFNNSGVTDGNVYGLVLNNKGVAVNGFPGEFTEDKAIKDVIVQNVNIKDLSVDIKEIPALAKIADEPLEGPQVDVVGAVFQTYGLVDESGSFLGNLETAPIQIAQAMIANAIEEGVSFNYLPIDKSSISKETIDWVSGETSFGSSNLRYILNGDSMHHVNKGLIGTKVDGAMNISIQDITISNIQNKSKECMAYSRLENYPDLNNVEESYDLAQTKLIKGATANGAGMNDVRGISFASSQNVMMNDVVIDNIGSTHGPAFGIDVQFESDYITGENMQVTNLGENSGELPGSLEFSKKYRINISDYNLIDF